jgi:hypothetical protein
VHIVTTQVYSHAAKAAPRGMDPVHDFPVSLYSLIYYKTLISILYMFVTSMHTPSICGLHHYVFTMTYL